MTKAPGSLRRRLQVWYGLVLGALILVFGSLLYLRVRQMQLQRVDAELVAIADYLDANLRGFPPHELNSNARPPENLPPPPPHHSPELLLANLNFPEASGIGRDTNAREAWYFQVVREDGSLIKASPKAPQEFPKVEPWPRLRPQLQQAGSFRQALMLGPHETRIVVAKSVREELADVRGFGFQLLGIGLTVLAGGLAGGWWISGRLVRPLREMSRVAESISETNLSERIELEGIDDELVGLATTLNVTFDRLEKAFAQQAQLTADASHELRTPLATLRTQAELTLSKPRTPDEYRQALSNCLDVARRMTRLVDGMMTLARADAGQLSAEREPIDFAKLVSSATEQLQPLAFSKQVRLNLHVGPAQVTGDATNLARVVTNLVSNAIYYNRPHGKVDVQLRSTAESVVLIVRDTGKGIPEESRDHLFNRFFRADKSRSRSSGGHGLGLAITKAIVEAHGGYIDFTSEEESGTTFRVRLPRADLPAAANP